MKKRGIKRLLVISEDFCQALPVTPTPSTFSKVLPYKSEAYCRTNRRRTAVQMGGVLLGFSFFKASSKPGRYSDTNGVRIAVQIGGLQYFVQDQ